MSFLSLDILSTITFSIVLIHFALMPTFEPISRPQKNLARAFLARVQCPIECICIICDTQDNWEWVIIDLAIFKHNKRCAVIKNDGHKFQAVDWNEGYVWTVLEVQKCSLNYFHLKGEMPPKFQSDWIATTRKQGTITNDQCCWGSWDQMSNRCLKLDSRVRRQCFWKEV